MNVQTCRATAQRPSRDAAAAALDLLRDWAAGASVTEIAALHPAVARLLPGQEASNYPDLARLYPAGFTASEAYRASLPDLQNGPASLIRGRRAAIQHVGVSNFRLPLRYQRRDGGEALLETSVAGTVSLGAQAKGINMSRIMRSFYDHAGSSFSLDTAQAALADQKARLGSLDARIAMRLSYPMQVESLRSGLHGFQFYDICLELVDQAGQARKMLHLDYVYASTCPCSLELSEHARQFRGQLATPHAQRSVARISVELMPGPRLWFEDLVELCRRAVPTETQVMVKREDEQAFAELCAANPVFVEDAVRLFAAGLSADPRIGDYRVAASHQESLHSHDAVSVLTEGPTFAQQSLDPGFFATLQHPG
jgi:GTP cyclohydrolase I